VICQNQNLGHRVFPASQFEQYLSADLIIISIYRYKTSSSAIAERSRDSVVENFTKSLKITQGHSNLHR